MANFKPIYAQNNLNWRIVYFPGGWWQLQEACELPKGADLRHKQPWIPHNSRMTKEAALQALSGHNLQRRA